MARFYGTVQGGRGMASRLGHATTGLTVTAQSYSGDIRVQFRCIDGEDYVVIHASDHGGCRSGQLLYSGPVKDLLEAGARIRFLQQAVGEALAAE